MCCLKIDTETLLANCLNTCKTYSFSPDDLQQIVRLMANATDRYMIECWEDGPIPPIVINSSIWAIVECTAAQMQKDNRFLRNKEIRDTEFLEVSARIYNELLGFASEKFDILNIKEFV